MLEIVRFVLLTGRVCCQRDLGLRGQAVDFPTGRKNRVKWLLANDIRCHNRESVSFNSGGPVPNDSEAAFC
jgi:hypothetical protein